MAFEHAAELGMGCVRFKNMVYTVEEGYMTDVDADAKGLETMKLSGTKFRKMLRGGEDIPDWFAFKSVIEVLRSSTTDV
jgi:sulfate adenylyltransferase